LEETEALNSPTDVTQTSSQHGLRSFLVACVQDVEMFSSGPEILGRTVPYPDRVEFDTQQLPIMRPKIETLLSKETAKTKEQLYTVSV
jgi:hypothetical protein